MESIQSLPLGRSLQRRILSLALGTAETPQDPSESPSTAGPLRIDLSKGSKGLLYFFNNLEKDVVYGHIWPRSLRTLFQPSWGLPPIARNLYTTVCVADVLTFQGASIFMQAVMVWQQRGLPLRIGFVPYVPSGMKEEVEGSEVLAMVFALHSRERGLETAVEALSAVAEAVLSKIPEDGAIPEDQGNHIAAALLCLAL